MAVLLGLTALLGLSGCSSPDAAPRHGLQVVTTTTQVSEFTQTVLGSAGQVTGLLTPHQSSHAFDPSAGQLLKLARADVLVINGADLEPWVADMVEASGFQGKVIDASQGIGLLKHNGVTDPHIWTDPNRAQKMVANIATGLSQTDPPHAAEFATNAQNYKQQLKVLNQWIEQNLQQVPVAQRVLVTNHDALTYFVERYQVTFVGSIVPSFDDNAEPSVAELDALIAAIKKSGASAIFSEATISDKLAATIAREAGIRVYSGEDALYADSLGQPGSSGETYIASTVHNVQMLMQSWGVTPLPVPQELTYA